MTEQIMTAIREADLVLVGLGEEFDEIGKFRKENNYMAGKKLLEEAQALWLLPVYDKIYRQKKCPHQENDIVKGLGNLAELLEDKNYFVVSTAVNDLIRSVPWKEGRLVMPCGEISRKQCAEGCEEGILDVSEEEQKKVFDYIAILQEGDDRAGTVEQSPILGVCPSCGKPLVLNNIYAEKYDEKGYQPDWQLYMKWLQGTLNKKLVILELGVGMKFPSVIRWPFEKIAFFNNKAHIFRVNEKLYQLSEELKGKGTAIPKKSIDWLMSMC